MEAEIKLYINNNEYLSLTNEINIEEIAIVSKSHVLEGYNIEGSYKEDSLQGIEIVVSKANGHKCARCWKIDENIKNGPLCDRCNKVVK